MPFRDRVPTCPRCRVELARAEDDREAWHCPRCTGTALGIGDLVDDLLDVAPHLRPTEGVRDLRTISRRAAADLACPACGIKMEPVYLAAVEIDRCHEDNLVWLDRNEREAIVARAQAQPGSGLFDHLRTVLRGPSSQSSAPTSTDVTTAARGSRIKTIISLLVILMSLPLGLLGGVLVLLGDSSRGGGAVGGLAGLATDGGVLLVASATIMFVGGGIVFIRSAGE